MPASVPVGSATSCTATVTDASPGTASRPTGWGGFWSRGVSSSASSCTLGSASTNPTTGAVSTSCAVSFTPNAVAIHTITASYSGDTTHAMSSGTTVVTATTVVSPQTTPGKVTGGGVIDVPGGRANFGFVAQRKTTGGPASGNLNYLDHTSGRHVHVPVTSLTIIGNSAEFGGSCGPSCTFTVAVQDNAEPDGSGKDTFYITVTASPPYRAGGTIRSGNIQVHGDNPPAPSQGGSVVTGGGGGIFPTGASFNGVSLNGLQFGKGVGIPGDSSAIGDFQAVLLGTSLLGRPQNINVVGRPSSGSLNPDGSAVFAGLCTVDMGDGTPPLIGLPFSVTATTESLRLILGTTPLPAATLTAGSITIQ